jgi:phenylacetate-CoA ligase
MLKPGFPAAELAQVLTRAGRTAAYRSTFSETALVDRQDWQRLPLTTKQTLREAYPLGLLAVPMSELATYHESSGTSGKPVASFFTEADWEDVFCRFQRNAVGLSANDVVFVKTPYSLVTTAHQMHGAARRAGATVVPADNRSSNMPYSRVVRLLRDLPITVAWCLPTESILWAYAARKLGGGPFPNLRAFVVAGEAMSPARKRRISSLWSGVKVFEDYGSTETGTLAGECLHGKLHLWSDHCYFEVRDPISGAFTETGRGHLVVTPMYREAMPLVRYDTEDLVEVSSSPCACGSALPVVRVLGRGASLTGMDGESFGALELEQAVYGKSRECGLWFWRARRSSGRLEIQIHADRPREAERAVRETVRDELGLPVSVENIPAESFVPEALLGAEAPMQKPRFLLAENEDWNTLNYA